MTLTQITKVRGPGIHTQANIVSNSVSLGGIATASNFKTGTSNLHNVGLEIAGINVLGADTPIGTGATIYDAGGAIFTGVVTATSFSGNSATATLATNASGLTGTPDIAVRNITGVGATLSGALSGTTASFSGNVSIGGTLTYEDVTNIDAVGLITARNGLKLTGGNIDIANPASGNVINLGSSTVYANAAINIYRLGNGYADMRLSSNYGAKVALAGASNNTDELYIQQDNQKNAYIVNEADKEMYFQTNGSTRMTVAAGGNVGIGLTNAGEKLSVNGKIEARGGNWFIARSGDNSGYAYIRNPETGGSQLAFNTSGEKMRILSNGKVGINTTAPQSDLQIITSGQDQDGTLRIGGSVSDLGLVLDYDQSGSTTARIYANANYNSDTSLLKICSDLDDNPNQLVLAGSGKVGIATVTPRAKFDVRPGGHSGNGAVTFTTGLGEVGSSNNAIQAINGVGSALQPLGYRATEHIFATQTAERIRFTSTGQFHMGGGGSWTYASQKFVVVEPSNALGMLLQGNNANQGVNLTLQNINNGGSAYSDLSFADDGGQIFGAVRGKVIDRDNNHGELQFHTSAGSLTAKFIIDKDGKLTSQGSGAQLYLQSSSSSTTVNTAVFYTSTSGKHNKVQLKTFANGGGDPFIHFDGGGQNFIVGQRYVGTTNNLLVLGPGDDPDITTGIIIKGTGDVFIGRDGGLSDAKLSIQCDAGEAGIAVQANGSAGATNLLQVYNSAGPNTTTIVQENTTATPALVFKIYDGSSSTDEKVRINQSGLTVTGEVAASQDYPNIRPSLDLNFTQVKKLDPRISFHRTGSASYVDEFGLVRVVGDNIPRFDHDPITGECKGLLMEDARTNDNKCSINQWDATGWAVSRSSIQHYPSETAPDGSTNVALVYPNTENSNHYAYISHAGQNRTGVRTISAWFKKLSTTTYYPQLRIFGVGNGVAHATFTLTGDGSVSSSGSATTGATITPYPNGWYRCTLSWNHGSAHYGGGWVFGNHASNELPTFTGDADRTKGFLVWGFQEESSAWPSSFIPTAGQGVESRQGDEAYIDGQDFTDAYNVAEGTFVLKQSVDETSTSNQWGWGVERSSNRSGFLKGLGFRVGGGGAGHVGAWYVDNGSQQAFFNMNTGVTVNKPFTAALAYKLNDIAATATGFGTVGTDTSATIASAGEFDRFTLGSYHYDSMSVGHIQRVMYYKKRLPNSQLLTLTS